MINIFLFSVFSYFFCLISVMIIYPNDKKDENR